MPTIDMPGSLDDLDKLFAVSDFLSNTEELLKIFQPSVKSFLVKKGFFTGPFRRSYLNAFDDLIISLIKRQIIQHFPSFTPEEILLLTEKDFIKMLGSELFDPENYRSREGLS